MTHLYICRAVCPFPAFSMMHLIDNEEWCAILCPGRQAWKSIWDPHLEGWVLTFLLCNLVVYFWNVKSDELSTYSLPILFLNLCILDFAGRKVNEEPKRVNGTLKKVWRCMDHKPIEWISLKKPSLSISEQQGKASTDAAQTEQA